MKGIIHKTSKLFIIFGILCLALSLAPKKAKAYSWSFGFGYGGFHFGVSRYSNFNRWRYYPRRRWSYYPWLYGLYRPVVAPRIRGPQLSLATQNRMYDQTMRLLRHKMTVYYAHKLQVEAVRILEKKRIEAEFTTKEKVEFDSIEETIETTPQKDNSEEPSTEYQPTQMLVADNGSVVVKLY